MANPDARDSTAEIAKPLEAILPLVTLGARQCEGAAHRPEQRIQYALWAVFCYGGPIFSLLITR